MSFLFGSDPPPAPSPVATAAASTSTNVSTALANAFLNNTNQITPQGSVSYNVTGEYPFHDPYSGLDVSIPRFTATQELSQNQKDILAQTEATKYNLAGVANNQSRQLGTLLANPMDVSGAPTAGSAAGINAVPQAATTFGNAGSQQTGFDDAGAITKSYGPGDFSADRSRVEDSLYGRLNPQLAKERSNIEQRLADQGIRYGSQAYTSAMDDYNRQSNDARLAVTAAGGQEQQRMMDMAAQRAGFENSAQKQAYDEAQGRGSFANQAQQNTFQQEALRGQFANAGLAQQLSQAQAGFGAQNTARGQYLNEQYAQRNQPINEISALLSGSQISNPNFISTPNNQIPTTDVAGLINNRFSQDMDAYKVQSANQQALIGGVLGFAGNVVKSDARSKENKVRIGTVFATERNEDESADGPIDSESSKRLPIYSYSYKDDPSATRHVGPMAQDVEKIDRKAVTSRGGVKYIRPDRVMGNVFSTAQG